MVGEPNQRIPRDRDAAGGARNARPRDGLGRPLPYGSVGVPRQPEGVQRTVDETIDEAQRLLDEGKPFHAHEIFEDAWKATAGPERRLWKALAQFAVGVTHGARGNPVGGAAVLRRCVDTLGPLAGSTPHELDLPALVEFSRTLADRLDTEDPERSAPVVVSPPRLRVAGPARSEADR